VLTGGRLTVEDAYAYAKFARVALHTNDIDFRARPHSAEELDFLASRVVGTTPEDGVTFAAIEAAPATLLVAFEPEEEAPIVFLRLRKAARKNRAQIFHIGQWTSPAVEKTIRPFSVDKGSIGTLLACPPGGETAAVEGLVTHAPDVAEGLSKPGAVILVGERAAQIPGLLTELVKLAEVTGAKLAWIPRRAGERAALDAGAAPTLLPGGRLVTDADARSEVEQSWGLAAGSLPSAPGRDTAGILAAAANGSLDGLLVGGVEVDDLPDPVLAEEALRKAGFVVSLELRASAVTEFADVVLPVAPAVEKSGTFVNWEGRRREFGATLENTGTLPDCRVLDTLGVEMDVDLFTQTPKAAAGDLAKLPAVLRKAALPVEIAAPAPTLGEKEAVLATWRQLLDNGSLQSDEPHLAGTQRPAVVRLNPETAARFGVNGTATVKTEHGSVTLPVEHADLPDGVVWLPTNSGVSKVRRVLRAGHGDVVTVTAENLLTGSTGGE
jgi:NADH-quinone oxidoreductase subunit G